MSAANHRYEFASDNTAGMMPELMDELVRINSGAVAGYGRDPHTLRAKQCIQEFFETDAQVHFVFNGTAANVLSLAAVVGRHEHVLAHPYSHLENDECGAPEFFGAGSKVKSIGGVGTGAKISVEDLKTYLLSVEPRQGDVHFSPPGLLSLTQVTELGLAYTPSQIRALADLAHSKNIHVHMDGARFFYALQSMGCTPAELTWKAGVDILSLGGTKIGMGPTEAVVVFDKKIATKFHYFQKQGAQLASKMRYLSAPWVPLIEKELWKKAAEHSIESAKFLAQHLEANGVSVLHKPEANSVFAQLTRTQKNNLELAGWHAYDFQEQSTRLMTSWLTTPTLIEALLSDLFA